MSSVTIIVPFILQVWFGADDYKAVLNQDGTWTITGEAPVTKQLDSQTKCMLQQLETDPPTLNSNPDNSHELRDYEMTSIICRDRRIVTCGLCPAGIV